MAQTGDENVGELREQLNAADGRIKELLKVHLQMLDHLIDSQVKTSEIRGEVEQTRWQLLQESGVQKTELLRAHQDMVNRIIQIGEKSLERKPEEDSQPEKPERRYPLRERKAKVFTDHVM
jgi:hypothetical protein